MKATTIVAAAICLAGALATGAAGADTLSKEAAEAMSKPPLYLPASPSNPGGLKGHDHSSQIDFTVDSDEPGEFKRVQAQLKNMKPKTAVAGPQVNAGSYKLAPVHGDH